MQLRQAVVPFSNGKDLGLNYTIEFLMVSEDIPQMSNLTVHFSTLSGRLEVTGVSSTELYVSDGSNVVTRFTTVQISFMNDGRPEWSGSRS